MKTYLWYFYYANTRCICHPCSSGLIGIRKGEHHLNNDVTFEGGFGVPRGFDYGGKK